MKKNRYSILALAMVLSLACSFGSAAQTQQPQDPRSTYTPLPTYTPFPTFTEAAPAATLAPTATVAPSIPVDLAREWKGTYRQTGYGTVGIGLLIESMTGGTFKGKMLWYPTSSYGLVITRMNGEVVTDFGDAFDQGRWSEHPDFQNGIGDGTWLKWTETEMISGNWIFTMNGWYYAHIRSDGTMVGIYYFNATETTPASDSWEMKATR